MRADRLIHPAGDHKGPRRQSQQAGSFVRERPNIRPRLDDLRQLRFPDANRIQHVCPPGIPDQVIVQGGAGDGTISNDSTGQAIDQVILYQQELVSALENIRLVLADPQDLAGWPGGDDLGDAGPGIDFRAEPFGQESSLVDRAVVQPDQGGINRPPLLIQYDGRLALAGNRCSLHLSRLDCSLGKCGAHSLQTGLPVHLGVKLSAVCSRSFELILLASQAQAATVG